MSRERALGEKDACVSEGLCEVAALRNGWLELEQVQNLLGGGLVVARGAPHPEEQQEDANGCIVVPHSTSCTHSILRLL
jgi:hypothetical protein